MTTEPYPNVGIASETLGKMTLGGMEEIIGRTGINAVLNLAMLTHLAQSYLAGSAVTPISFADLSKILDTIEMMYGPRGGQGLALRTGRAMFNIYLRYSSPAVGLLDLDFRLQPLQTKILAGLQSLARFQAGLAALPVRIEEDEAHFYWFMERCPFCWNRASDSPVCYMMVGFLQEYLYWVSGGKYFNVSETRCIAAGSDACVIQIDKQAFE
jgi:hypothetical protein